MNFVFRAKKGHFFVFSGVSGVSLGRVPGRGFGGSWEGVWGVLEGSGGGLEGGTLEKSLSGGGFWGSLERVWGGTLKKGPGLGGIWRGVPSKRGPGLPVPWGTGYGGVQNLRGVADFSRFSGIDPRGKRGFVGYRRKRSHYSRNICPNRLSNGHASGLGHARENGPKTPIPPFPGCRSQIQAEY